MPLTSFEEKICIIATQISQNPPSIHAYNPKTIIIQPELKSFGNGGFCKLYNNNNKCIVKNSIMVSRLARYCLGRLKSSGSE